MMRSTGGNGAKHPGHGAIETDHQLCARVRRTQTRINTHAHTCTCIYNSPKSTLHADRECVFRARHLALCFQSKLCWCACVWPAKKPPPRTANVCNCVCVTHIFRTLPTSSARAARALCVVLQSGGKFIEHVRPSLPLARSHTLARLA